MARPAEADDGAPVTAPATVVVVESSRPEVLQVALAVGLPVLFNGLILWAAIRTLRRRRAERQALDQ